MSNQQQIKPQQTETNGSTTHNKQQTNQVKPQTKERNKQPLFQQTNPITNLNMSNTPRSFTNT